MSTVTVATKSAAVIAMEEHWELAAALLGGTTAMRKAGVKYLPRWPKEDEESYKSRLSVSVLFPAYKRTIKTLAGKPFSKPVTRGDDIPPRLQPWLDDVDLQGRNIDAFGADAFERVLGYGLAGILVEYPETTGVLTQAQEARAGLRPYWVEIRADQILGWRATRVDGLWQLTQLRFLETVDEPDSDYVDQKITQVRVLTPGAWEIWRKNERGDWVLYREGQTTLLKVPFVPLCTRTDGFMVSEPPLIEVAHLNVAHWQSSSDQQNILHVVRVPILTATGIEDDKWTLTVGSATATKLPSGARLEFVEHSGSAIGAGATELEKLEERMRQAGAELLVLAPGRITATQVATENAVGMCVLQRMTQDFENALNKALQLMAEWVGEATGGRVKVFNDYGAATLEEASAQLLLSANQAGKLSDETLHAEFQRRGILSADLTWDDERSRIEEQGPSLNTLTAAPTDPAAAPTTPSPSLDVTALAAAIDRLAAIQEVEPRDAEPLDMSAIAAAIASISIPAPSVTVESPVINVTVPEQQPPVVNVTPAPITVEAPQINMPAITVTVPEQQPPVVNIAPAAVNIAPPAVNVTVQKPGSVAFSTNEDGDISGATFQ